jgi:peptidylprolyl isomerase
VRFAHRFGIIVAVLACGACSADPTGDAASSSTTPAPIATAPTTPAPTTPAPISPDQCAQPGDLVDLVNGAVPQAVRPCSIPTTLMIQDLQVGSGRAAAAGDTVYVDYTGIRSADGVTFDSSYARDRPIDFPLGRGGVIEGWDEGLLGAQAGTVRRLDIPAELAYGEAPPVGEIRPGDALTFILEVRAVIPPVTPDQAPLEVHVTPSIGAKDVTFIDVTVGTGATVEQGDTALVHLLLVRGDNADVLYNTWDRNELVPVPIGEDSPIPGLGRGLEGAQVGSLRVISMPPTLAFGEAGDSQLGLPAGTDLIIVAEVFGVT